MLLLSVLLCLLTAYLAFGVLYQLFFAVAGLLPAPEPAPRDAQLRRFAVFITAQRGDSAILETARRTLKQRYPGDRFEVVVLADGLRAATLAELRHLPIELVEVRFCESTKGKSLREGLLAMHGQDIDAAVVLDAGDQLAPDFLLEANRYLAAGFRAVQGQRKTAPNVNSGTSAWRSIGEAVDNHILCTGHHAVGLSARLAGSGMAFEFGLFEEIMLDVHTPGELDTALALRLTQGGVSIGYAPRALVYGGMDVGPPDVGHPRGDLHAWSFDDAFRYLAPGMRALLSGRLDFANKAIQAALPPRLLLPAFLLVAMTVALPFSLGWSAVFGSLFLLSATSFALAIPPQLWQSASWLLLSQLPEVVWQACRSAVMLPASAKTAYRTVEGEKRGRMG